MSNDGSFEGSRTAGETTLLLLSGSAREGSTNAATLRTAAQLCPAGVHAYLYDGLDRLPHFNPDLDAADPQQVDPRVADLRRQIAGAAAMLVCTPEYAGTMPGALKNLLEWTVGGTETSGKPVAWINVSTSVSGAAGTHEALRTVLTYTDARVVDEACVSIPVSRSAIGADGVVTDEALRRQIEAAVTALLAAAGR